MHHRDSFNVLPLWLLQCQQFAFHGIAPQVGHIPKLRKQRAHALQHGLLRRGVYHGVIYIPKLLQVQPRRLDATDQQAGSKYKQHWAQMVPLPDARFQDKGVPYCYITHQIGGKAP